MQKISPCLWFDDNAEEAVAFYSSIFRNSRFGKITRYGKEGHDIHGIEDRYCETETGLRRLR